MSFIKIPYLPKSRVVLGVGDVRIESAKVIKPYRVTTVPESMSLHADLSFCYLGRGVAVCAPEAYAYYSENLKGINLNLIKGEGAVGSNYPFDAAYNVAIVGDRIYCKKDSTDRVLLKVADSMGYKITSIKQGYAKCSVCPVDENSAISADMSFYNAAVKDGMDVLRITNSKIYLEGFENGFFGGCTYSPQKGVLTAKGDMSTLPEYEEIEKFLKKRNISIALNSGQVTDFGSFIPIMEE